MNDLLLKQYIGLIECNNEKISILANTSAFIMQNFQDISWAGFYLFKNTELILGPFQGKIACTNIPLDKGVCGKAASTRDRKSTRLNSSHIEESRMPSSA